MSERKFEEEKARNKQKSTHIHTLIHLLHRAE